LITCFRDASRGYFDTIPHAKLLKTLASISDGAVLALINQGVVVIKHFLKMRYDPLFVHRITVEAIAWVQV